MTNDITVRVGADAGPLRRGMNAASRSVSDFSAETKKMAVDVAKAGAVVVTAVSAIGAGVLKMASEAAQVGVEIKNLAAVAGTSTDNFQRMAAASRTVGVEQDKLADILKDVNDKFGDYMETGAGPLADFFENIAPKIGVTADQFANLAGPDALQLYVSSLEKAGVNQQQMTFYMEALASDATALLPLLRDNGVEMARFGQAAADAGRILSDEMIAGAIELDRELADLANTLKIQTTKAVIEHKDEIKLLVDFITEQVIPAVAKLAETLGTVATGWIAIAKAAEDAIGPLARAAGLLPQAAFANEPGNVLPPPINPNAGGGGDVSMTGTGYIDANGNWVEYGTGAETPTQPGINAPSLPMTAGTPLDPSGGLLPEQSPLDAARAAWEATQELQEEIRTGTADHEAELTRIEDDARRERERLAAAEVEFKRQAMATLYNDLTSLMSSENDKLFKIGKAAAIAEATISGYYSAQKAYEGGLRVSGGNIAVGAAFAAASIAKTAGVISSLQSTQPNGGGRVSSGGAGAASTPAAGGQEQGITQNRSLTLIGDNFNRKQAIDIAEYMNEGTDNGLIIRGRA